MVRRLGTFNLGTVKQFRMDKERVGQAEEAGREVGMRASGYPPSEHAATALFNRLSRPGSPILPLAFVFYSRRETHMLYRT
jgi:hypothetical protein